MRKSFDQPDESQDFPLIEMDIMRIGDWNVYKFTFEPGWCWTEHWGPYAETETCQQEHPFFTMISGKLIVKMDDGREEEFGPGDVGFIPPGHDAWVVGDEPVVALDFQPADSSDS